MNRYCLLTILAALNLGVTFAQSGSSAAVQRKINKGIALYQKGQKKKAAIQFHSLMPLALKQADVYSKIGEFYFENNKFQDAAYFFEMGSKSVFNGKRIFAIPLTKAYLRAGLPEKASASLKSYSVIPGRLGKLDEEAARLQKSIDFGRLVNYNTHNTKVENLRWPVNSELNEYAPSFSHIRQDLVFNRNLNTVDENFFEANLDTCGFFHEPLDMGLPLNSAKPESYQTRAYSGHYMIYQKCDNRSVNGWALGGCDLYLSHITSKGWADPVSFGYTLNTTHFEGMPSLSPHENALFFVSDRPGGYGGYDIWVSYFKNGRWQVPVNLGPEVNSAKDEWSPSIAADGKTLLFASNGLPGFGGFDLFMTTMQSDSSWSNVQNLGTPINTSFDETGGSIDLDGAHFYFSSDRPGGFGGFDIYNAVLPKKFQIKPHGLILGRAVDFETGSFVTSTPIQINAQKDKSISINLKTNVGDGSFYAVLPLDDSFILDIKPRFYQEKSQSFVVNKALDSVILKMYPEGYVPVEEKLLFLEQPFSCFSERLKSDTFCSQISDSLQNYSGKISKIILEVFLADHTVEVANDRLAPLRACVTSMGIDDEHFELIYLKREKDSSTLSEDQIQIFLELVQ